ncbi:carboxylesterase family protein [Pseudenhygromyxa sp. WMMC2535]|uniref:carboxylesterase/lipase family protein n=1 Tax=Pseudenhygromyxa sp. WMMC2535 TaxID=2712867 RepID=UPI001554FC83|nr:carboxylesterase family protein [Pseudenhygromyxa sp. WMMC2535]NVB41733.1 carboxylesterase family protein [Pseudenhygromyxa sp. WMMC2535]
MKVGPFTIISQTVVFSAAILSATGCAGDGQDSEPELAETASGPVRGEVIDGVRTFLGIPYAAAPVGALRFAPTEAHPGWSDPLVAKTFASVCPQLDTSGDTEVFVGDEDCLYLNVWAPEGGEDLPVMVWIHGGAFLIGAGSDPIYDGATLAKTQDVVVVTINYRLGSLGFLATPELLAESGTGNFGMLDQIAALEWVQANIAAFGGDPGRVTIAGQSAGGESVLNLLGSPRADGLYQGAIIQSGGDARDRVSPGDANPDMDPLALGADLLETLGCGAAEEPLACLRGVTSEAIISAQGAIAGLGDLSAGGPFLDGELIPEQPFERIANGESPAVPLMIGFTAEEAGTLPEYIPIESEAVYAVLLEAIYPGLSEAIMAIYSVEEFGDPSRAMAALLGDQTFVCGALAMADAAPAPRYVYRFSHTLTGEGGQYGAFHAIELPYEFGNLDTLAYDAEATADDEAVSAVMLDAWGRFVREGAPGEDWAPWSAGQGALDIQVAPAMTTDLGQDRCAQLSELGVVP